MANIRVKQALDRIETELNSVYKQIAQYSGVDEKDARIIDTTATNIASMAADIAGLARQVMGNTSGVKLHKQVRKTLGFTNP